MADVTSNPKPTGPVLDALVIGAGFAGMYALHRFRRQGLRVRVLEAASDVGGTWYWNRYPGARCDVPSIEYSYSFSQELEQEWDWTEVMAGQPEILRYANHVADRFDLRSGIQFDTKVVSVDLYQRSEGNETAKGDRSSQHWRVTTEAGELFEARFCIMATGCLSAPNTPPIEGAESFAGPVYHTGRWPHEGVDFDGVHVGIIGTGSSGVQAIPVIAGQAKHLTVLQRTPNYTVPAYNRPVSAEERERSKAGYAEIRRQQRASFAGILFGFGGAGPFVAPTETLLGTTPEQRQAAVDANGFAAVRRYADVQLNLEANELACEMYRDQVSRIIHNPETAQGLMPRGYPIGCKRPVIDTDYFDTFNRENVTLVDLRRGGIERITPAGVETEQGPFDFDALIYATGFDAMTGPLLRMDIRGRGGVTLQSTWEAGPRTYLGLQVHGFPNLFTVTGPGSPSVLSNMFVSIEQHVDWIADCIRYLDDNGLSTIEATEEAQDEWIAHANDVASQSMMTARSCNSWYLGANIPGKPRIFMPYIGGVGAYRQKCDEVADRAYEGFQLE